MTPRPTVLTRAATTVTILAIFLYGTWLHIQGLVTIGEIVTFVNIATLFVGKLELVVGFSNRMVLEIPRLVQFFEVLDSVPIKDKRGAIDLGRVGRAAPADVRRRRSDDRDARDEDAVDRHQRDERSDDEVRPRRGEAARNERGN